MKFLLAILVLLVIGWLFLPFPTGDSSISTPEERTREFPVSETPVPTSEANRSGQQELVVLPPEAIAPNPLLEVYVDQDLREGPYRVEITYPNNEARLTQQADGTHLFRLAGRISLNKEVEASTAKPATTTENEEEADMEEEIPIPGFRVHFFSNKPVDYESFLPVFTEDISFQVEGEYYVFQLSHPEELDPGLYYYLIEASESGEVFYVGKVSVAS